MAFPRNEAETIELFRLIEQRIGWRIIQLQTAFPDATIENERGQRLVVEFEFESKNFGAHKHDPSGCDLIIAYWNNWENPPVPVWELRGCAREEALIIEKLFRIRRLRWVRVEEMEEKLHSANQRIWELESAIAQKWMPLAYKETWGIRLLNWISSNPMLVYMVVMFVSLLTVASLTVIWGR